MLRQMLHNSATFAKRRATLASLRIVSSQAPHHLLLSTTQQQQQQSYHHSIFLMNHHNNNSHHDDHHFMQQHQQHLQPHNNNNNNFEQQQAYEQHKRDIEKTRQAVGDLSYSDLERLTQSALDLVEQGEECLEEDEFRDGAQKCTRAIDVCGMINNTLLRLTLSDRLRDGISEKTKLAESRAYLNRAMCKSLEVQRDLLEIHSDFQRAMQLSPYDARSYYSYAAYLLSLKKADLCFMYLNTAIELNPTQPLAYLRRAEARDMVGAKSATELGEMMNDCTMTIQNGCNDPQAYYLRAKAILENRSRPDISDNERHKGVNWSIDQALDDLTKAMKAGGYLSHKILFTRAICLASKTQFTEAINNLYAARLVLQQQEPDDDSEYEMDLARIEMCLDDVKTHARMAKQTVPECPSYPTRRHSDNSEESDFDA